MKGYIINNRCYVFPQEVGQIPSVEAEVIYVQEEDIKSWKEANVELADKIKKYNYNVMTVNPKEWSGHKDDELEPVQTYYNIIKEGEGIETISVVDQATAGETVTISLVDPETYTFDLTNKTKQRIWIGQNLQNIEYHQAEDNYTFTMEDYDISILVDRYNGYTLTVTVDGQEKSSVEDFSNILNLFDSKSDGRITDLTDVIGGHKIDLNTAEESYSFNAEDTTKTHVVVKLNGTELEANTDPMYRYFIMPSENATLEITTTAPQTLHSISAESYNYGDANAADLIQFDKQSATAGETVTVTLIDPGTFTFDIANKEKRRIWLRIYEGKEYHQDGDYYTFTMPDSDTSILAGYYNGYTLTVTVDGQQASSIEDVRFLGLHDNSYWLNITDLTDVCRGSDIQINLGEGYTFDTSLTDKIIVTAKFNGTNLEGNVDWAIFNMPSENATLEITTTRPQA